MQNEVDAIFTFAKPVQGSVQASSRIAHFVSEQVQIPMYWDEKIAQQWRNLFIVGGAFAFCDALPHIGKAVELAERVIWIQNDYTIIPPKAESAAESPFRKAFRNRKASGLRDMDYWTTIKKFSTVTQYSRYINWNMLTYEPLQDNEYETARKTAIAKILYYGAFRKHRVEAFDRFLNVKEIPWHVSGNGKFLEKYPHLEIIPKIERNDFYKTLARYSLGLYLEDKKSHVEFHSPANRFYEMLSARLPMVFQREAISMMHQAGFDIRPYVVGSRLDLENAWQNAEKIREEQQAAWRRNYANVLIAAVEDAYETIL